MVRAKLVCYEKAEFQGWDSKAGKYCPAMKFKFQIVSSGNSPENDFYSHISGGTNMEIATINAEVFDKFKVNGEYFADLSPAPVT
jgi:hypothetical protein